jgi:trans-AT polyketide synthase/acyltransferase/oxidoreductase domain-containing protein
VIERAERSPRHKMALVFRWYFVHSTRLALKGIEEGKVDFQIQCGPAMGRLQPMGEGHPLPGLANPPCGRDRRVADGRVRSFLGAAIWPYI